MQERIITASALEDTEKNNEEIRDIRAVANQAADSFGNFQEAFLETGIDRAISVQVEDCLLSDKDETEVRTLQRRPSLNSRNRPIRWPRVIRILKLLGLRAEPKNGGSHFSIKKEDNGVTIATLAPENRKDGLIKTKLLLSHLVRAGVPREEVIAVMNQVL